ncbi:Hypothetical predicted protein [Pelobates cultripes]|uniref:Reverse transcriptase domain-containing protein n=1 Tax=Pelobates cultripes TaxID=61616 RepID=A0AAD1VT91_PELCU|nr:Hypothetical predicted protein [Pelobates cultripes]
MDRDYYIKEIRTQLNDTSSYQPMDGNPIQRLQTELQTLNRAAMDKGIITEGEYKYMFKKYPTTPVFYTLPKIHKNLQTPPGRPIVSGTDSILQPPAVMLDKFLIKCIPKQKSYIKDTNDLKKLINNLNIEHSTEVWLVTLDVQSLYTAIDHRGITSS